MCPATACGYSPGQLLPATALGQSIAGRGPSTPCEGFEKTPPLAWNQPWQTDHGWFTADHSATAKGAGMLSNGFGSLDRTLATPLSRRRAIQLLGAGSALGLASATLVSPRLTGAQASPAADLSSYPEVTITGEDFKFDIPSQFAGGYTKVTLKNASTEGNEHTALFLTPHPGKTIADVEAALKAAPTAADLGKIFAVASSVGGPATIDPGQQSTVIMNLPAGQYVVFCPIPGPNGMPHYAMGMQATVTVTAPATSLAAPQADLTVDLADFKFDNLSSTVAAGQHVWQVTNKGPQLHEMTLVSLAPGITFDQFKQMLAGPAPASPAAGSPAAGSPAAGGPPPAVTFGGAGAMNPGNTTWAVLDLKPGNDVALCFVPDQKTGVPHFMEGMIMPFTVQ